MLIVDYEVDEVIDMNMSSYKGVIKTTYAKLVEVLGKPTYTDSDPYEKVNAEWSVEVDTGEDFVKFSIYNWKTGYVPTEEYEWHIGGHDFEAKEIADAIFENHINKSEG